MEFKTDALLLRSVDYGENDKIVTLLTADRGKIGAGLKGVKKAGAKLRFAAQPFCFAEYVIAQKSARNTVVSASLHDGFFALREDVGTFYAAAAVCEICDKIALEGMDCAELLVAAVSALKEMCGGESAPALVSFLLKALRIAGYPVRAEDECPVCGKRLEGRMRFQMESGSFICGECANGVPASEITYRTIRAALSRRRLSAAECGDGEKRALNLLSAYFTHQAETELNALAEYIVLI